MKVITDRRVGEPDILTPVKHESLFVEYVESGIKEKICSPPKRGWTTESLQAFFDGYSLEESNANAYLGEQWIGSTEV